MKFGEMLGQSYKIFWKLIIQLLYVKSYVLYYRSIGWEGQDQFFYINFCFLGEGFEFKRD